jgi:hypothetical protein
VSESEVPILLGPLERVNRWATEVGSFRPSGIEGLDGCEKSKIKVNTTHFRNILIGDGKDENILNGAVGEWNEFKVKGWGAEITSSK